MGCAVLLLKANRRLILFDVAVVRFASRSILRLVLLTTTFCSRGSTAGASVGSADAKFHSSSSFACAATGACGTFEEARAANGSDAGAEGGLKAEEE